MKLRRFAATRSGALPRRRNELVRGADPKPA